MSKIVFVPLTDEMLFERPDLITGPITTYQPAILDKSLDSVCANDSLQASQAYLNGDLLSGFDVVYIGGEHPTRSVNDKRYRGFKRGI